MRLIQQFLVVTFVSIWVIVTYIVFWRPDTPGLRSTNSEDPLYAEFLEKLNLLEKSVDRQSDAYQKLVAKLLVLLESRIEHPTTPASTKAADGVREISLETIDDSPPFTGPVIPIIVFACNRISISNCLDNLIQYRPNKKQFPIIVSQVNHVSGIPFPL